MGAKQRINRVYFTVMIKYSYIDMSITAPHVCDVLFIYKQEAGASLPTPGAPGL